MKNSKRAIYLLLIFLTLADILLLCYVTFYPVSLDFKYGALTFDFIICVLLWIEFIYSYIHAEDKRKYVESNLLSIIGMLPVDFIFLRALRLVKLLNLIKIYVLSKEDGEVVSNYVMQFGMSLFP